MGGEDHDTKDRGGDTHVSWKRRGETEIGLVIRGCRKTVREVVIQRGRERGSEVKYHLREKRIGIVTK